MNFDSIDSFYKQLENQAKKSLIATANDIKSKLLQLIEDDIYGSYSPSVYTRTYELYEAIEVSTVTGSNGKYNIVIGIKDKIHNSNNNWITKQDSLLDIFNKFSEDGFYRRNGSIDVFEMAREEYIETGKAFRIIKDYLKSSGFDIK